MNQKNAIVTNLYFGRPPEYFSLFLDSCGRNPEIDFLFLTDFPAPEGTPPNVRFILTSFDDFRARVARLFDFAIALDSPYKICDFRPAFGEIFAEEFAGYRYWGHCDFDMIFGDLAPVSRLMNEGDYDKIFRRGHFTLYRNSDAVNQFYRTAAGKELYREVFASPAAHVFDETHGIDRLFREAGMRVHHEELIFDIKPNSPWLQKTSSRFGIGQYCVIDASGFTAHSVFGGKPRSFIYGHLQKRRAGVSGVAGSGNVLYLDQFGFKWVSPRAVPDAAWRSLLPNIGHLRRRLGKALSRYV